MELPVSLAMIRSAPPRPLPYRASWINRVTAWVDVLPGPAWCYYLALLTLIVGAQLAIAWWEGSFRLAIVPFAAVLSGSSVYYLATISVLDNAAACAFRAFRPNLEITAQQEETICYELTHLPARAVRMMTLVGIAGALLIITGVEQGLVHAEMSFFGRSLAMQLYWRVVLIADQILFWNLIYHTIHQLRVVNRIYSEHAKIDLFNLAPLYGLSRLTAYTAMSKVIIAYLWLASYPWLSNDYLVIGSWLVALLAALAGFVLPLLGIHRRLVEAKRQRQGEAGQWLETSIENFHMTIAARKLEEVDAMVKTLEGVQREQAILEQIPTWPWQPGTVRGLTTTIIAPVLLWYIVHVLEQLLSF